MKKLQKIILVVLYLALAVPMFYFTEGYFSLGGFGFMYMYVLGVGILVLAFAAFLISPNIKNGILTAKYFAIMSIPYFWSIIYSLVFWVVTMSPFRVITRGFFAVGYQFLAILVAAVTLYLFGNKGIYYQLFALVLANLIVLIQSIMQYGVSEVWSEFATLIVTFTKETGPIMKRFESSEHSFALAFFLLFFLLDLKKNRRNWPWFIVSLILFFMGLKRSVFFSIIISFLLGLILNKYFKKSTKKILIILATIASILAVVYIVAVDRGLYDWMEEIGISTASRNWIAQAIQDVYEVTIGYFGRGIGYVSGSVSLGQLDISLPDGYFIGDIHNDLLRQYIELGFIGYIIWVLLFLQYRIKYFLHSRNTDVNRRHGILTTAVLITLFITFATDNTNYYYYTTLFYSIAIMGYRYEEYANEIELPGENDI